jgi:hypothetical protein
VDLDFTIWQAVTATWKNLQILQSPTLQFGKLDEDDK